MIFDMTKRKGGGGTVANLSVIVQNDADSSGTVAIVYPEWDSVLNCVDVRGTRSINKGSSVSCDMLDQHGYISFSANVSIVSIKYNGNDVAYTTRTGGYGGHIRIIVTMPNDFDSTIPLIIKR